MALNLSKKIVFFILCFLALCSISLLLNPKTRDMIRFHIKTQNFGLNSLQTEKSVYHYLSLENTVILSGSYS